MWTTIFQAPDRIKRLFLIAMSVVFGGIGLAALIGAPKQEISVGVVFGIFGLLLLSAGLFLNHDWLKRFLAALIGLAVIGVIVGRVFAPHST
jgi:uncharacterized membrane-anchored protein YitT (DUF2179 family)